MTEQYPHHKSPRVSPGASQSPLRPNKNRSIRNAFVLAGVLALVLAGCGGNADQTTGTTTATTTATATATVTPTPTPGMSVQQVASTVAGLRAKNQKLIKDFERYCDMTKWSDSLVDAQALTCSLIVQRAPLEGQFAAKALRIANPPAEVTELLVATRNSATALGKVSSKQCEKSPKSDGCTLVETLKASEAAESFQLALAGWEPYL
jgi:hypothetical protein